MSLPPAPPVLAPTPRWERFTLGALLAAFFALASFYSALYYYNVVDDSLISLTYVKNFATGHGLVFNVGERVEGYTNFLWVIALAPVHLLSQLLRVDFVPLAVFATILTATADLFLLYVVGRRLWTHAVPALLAVALCAADNAYASWSIQALENHFFVLWVLLTLYLADSRLPRRGVLIGVCLACVQMTRPDGALFAVAFGTAQLLGLLFRQRERQVLTFNELAQAVLSAAAIYGAFIAFRYSYYGYPLPNTYYLKVGASKLDAWARGIAYVQGYFAERSYLPLLAVPAVLWSKRPVVRTLYLWVVLHLLYLCYVGGDFYPGHRFFVVLMPALALLCVQTLWGGFGALSRATGLQRAQPLGAVLLGSAVIASTAVLGVQRGPLQSEILRWRDIAEAQFRFMRWVGEHAPAGATIVAGDIGSAGYYAGLRVYDVFGIIDPVIAHRDVPMGKGKVGHEKTGDLAYFLAKKPTYIKSEYLGSDFYAHGYFLNTEMPPGPGLKGIWERDTLPQRATAIAGTHLTFNTRDDSWKASGDAFEDWPSRRGGRGQQAITGHRGGFISSFHRERGDDATGELRSAPFRIEGDLLTLRVAGGHDPQHLQVALFVDDQRVFTATGFGTESFSRKQWDVRAYKGRPAALRVIDHKQGGWGHIMLDEVQQWRLHSNSQPSTAAR